MRPRFRTKFVVREPNRQFFSIANLADINARVIDLAEIRRNTAGSRKMQRVNDDAGILWLYRVVTYTPFDATVRNYKVFWDSIPLMDAVWLRSKR